MIIAEIGSVHDGSFGNALELIKSAASSGADFVKFQTHIADQETLKSAPNPEYFQSEGRYEYFNRTAFTMSQWVDLKECAFQNNVGFMSSPFSNSAVDILQELDIPIYKIPSGEVTNIPMLEKIASLGKPVILSSGMSNWQELDNAVSVFNNREELTIMQCTSAYPCPVEKAGVNIIKEIKNRYGCSVGFSDHTSGYAASIAAAILGATVIEKHFTFSRLMYGSDAKHSMEPAEFSIFTNEVKNAWKMLQNPVDKNNMSDYAKMKSTFQKSIVALEDLAEGVMLELRHLSFKKPGDGISASEYKSLLGKKTNKIIKKDQKINFGDLE